MTSIGTKYILAQKFIFDPYSNTLLDQLNDNEVIRLGSNESRILLILIEQSTTVVSRDQLHEYVWRDQGFQVDDSSLTQAISTLRKMLRDSTKSPQFIKTIPKRGYQLISTVESCSANNAEAPQEDKTDDDLSHNLSATVNEAPVIAPTTPEAPISPVAVISPKPVWGFRLIWAVILLLPLLALSVNAPSSTQFDQVTLVNDVPLLQPENHPEIKSWLPAIERCTKIYRSRIEGSSSLEKIIATGSLNGQMALNFIHDADHSSQNQSILIFVDQTDFSSVCH
ncbi:MULTISPECIES: winged helix-turn-helix domain-containing protein [Vibrio]|uniref:Transcriptional regulator n=1 Tax=Vibrio algicola TaxID=2662262 RepID=A0A5Q0TEP8_9VIBR|nr:MULTISPECIES: transcriptional regulator [Vibrio]MBD1575878.1 transcriptional regulator [Vibrio sp. S11_S32]